MNSINSAKIAIVVSEFNAHITEKMLAGAMGEFAKQGVIQEHVVTLKVPGAVEIPLAAQRLARTQKYQAIVTLGAIILGDTDHYVYVCEQVNQGCQRVMLDESVPVIFGVMTVRNPEHARLRVQDDELNYGKQAATATLKMLKALEGIV